MLLTRFARNRIKNRKLNELLKLRTKEHDMELRSQDKYEMTNARTERFNKSSLPYIQTLLNQIIVRNKRKKMRQKHLIKDTVNYSKNFLRAVFYDFNHLINSLTLSLSSPSCPKASEENVFHGSMTCYNRYGQMFSAFFALSLHIQYGYNFILNNLLILV